jgi:hypothetical protein
MVSSRSPPCSPPRQTRSEGGEEAIILLEKLSALLLAEKAGGKLLRSLRIYANARSSLQYEHRHRQSESRSRGRPSTQHDLCVLSARVSPPRISTSKMNNRLGGQTKQASASSDMSVSNTSNTLSLQQNLVSDPLPRSKSHSMRVA